MIRLTTLLRTIMIAALLAFGLLASAPVAAQDEDPVDETTEQVDEATDAVGDEEDDGFDDWGLLGLLGLAGLAGLMRRPQPVVHESERTGYTGTTTSGRTGDRVDDTTL